MMIKVQDISAYIPVFFNGTSEYWVQEKSKPTEGYQGELLFTSYIQDTQTNIYHIIV